MTLPEKKNAEEDKVLSLLPIAVAYADDAAGAAGGGILGQMGMIPMIIVFGAIFYFIILRPQQKQAKQHKQMISDLKSGDAIVTSGGIHGRIVAVADDSFMVEIADKIKIKISKEAVALKKG